MSDVTLTEAERETIWTARKGAPWSFDPNWLQKAERAVEQIIAARVAEVTAERDRLREGLAASEHMRDVQRADRTARAVEDLRGRAEKAEAELAEIDRRIEGARGIHRRNYVIEAENARLRDTLARVEALAHDMKDEHGQSWNSISGQRILNALAGGDRGSAAVREVLDMILEGKKHFEKPGSGYGMPY